VNNNECEIVRKRSSSFRDEKKVIDFIVDNTTSIEFQKSPTSSTEILMISTPSPQRKHRRLRSQSNSIASISPDNSSSPIKIEYVHLDFQLSTPTQQQHDIMSISDDYDDEESHDLTIHHNHQHILTKEEQVIQEQRKYLRQLILFAFQGNLLELFKAKNRKCRYFYDQNTLNSMLCAAAANNNLQIINFLINTCGANIHIKDDAALCEATLYDSLHAANYLLENGANVNAQNNTPLMNAVLRNNKNMLRLLMSFGADPMSNDGALIRIARKARHIDLINMMLNTGHYSNTKFDISLYEEPGKLPIINYVENINTLPDIIVKPIVARESRTDDISFSRVSIDSTIPELQLPEFMTKSTVSDEIKSDHDDGDNGGDDEKKSEEVV
jgi:hypothetical protein